MQDRNRNKNKGLPDFFRYKRNQMSGKERNSFERELQKDQFAEEAGEGFESLSAREAAEDISHLQQLLRKRVTRHSRPAYYAVAASVAVMLAVSSILIIIESRKSQNQNLAVVEKPESPENLRSEPAMEPPPEKEISEQSSGAVGKRKAVSAENKAITVKSVQEMPAGKADLAEAIRIDTSVTTKTDHIVNYMKAERAAPVPLKAAILPQPSVYHATGVIISDDDKQPLAGVSIALEGKVAGVVTDADGRFTIELPDSGSQNLTASFIGTETKKFKAGSDSPVFIALKPSETSLSEVVVTAYGVAGDESETETDIPGYIPPEPSEGKAQFDKYIRDNIQRPDTLSTSGKLIVILSFMVKTDGSIDNIKVIKSPGKPFSDEAIRLLKSGPSWKPAEVKGKPTEERIRLRIVFR
jgi:hypothetical protein